jgi:hypothetical protein
VVAVIGIALSGFWPLAGAETSAALRQQASAVWTAMPATLLPARWPVSAGPAWQVWGLASDFEAADAVPVRDLSGDWARYTPRAGGNGALQSARIEIGAQSQRWEVAATVRSDTQIRGSRGAFDAVHAFKQRQTPPDGSDYAVEVHGVGATWAGLRVAHSWALLPQAEPGLELTAALSVLSARRVQQADVDGRVQFKGSTGYGFDIQARQQDSFRQFGGYGTEGAVGSGWTGDIGLLWQPSPGSFVNVSVVDLVSRLAVRDVSERQVTASSSTARLNSQGYVDYQPLLSGRYLSGTLRTTLGRKWSASAGGVIDGPCGPMEAGARWERIGSLDLPALWAALPVGAGWRLQLDADLRFGALGLGMASDHGSLMLRTRSLPLGQSRAYGWQAGYAIRF